MALKIVLAIVVLVLGSATVHSKKRFSTESCGDLCCRTWKYDILFVANCELMKNENCKVYRGLNRGICEFCRQNPCEEIIQSKLQGNGRRTGDQGLLDEDSSDFDFSSLSATEDNFLGLID